MSIRTFSRYAERVCLILLAAVVMLSCKKETASGVNGSVIVENGSAGGVTIELFENDPAADSYSVWVSGAAGESAVGFPYTAQAVFDWRGDVERRVLVASATTSDDGKFNFPDVADGDYLIVARKEGFGWSRPHTFAVVGKPVDTGPLSLFRETDLGQNAVISENSRWTRGRHYVFSGNLTIAEGATLTIEPGVVVRANQDGRIRVFGAMIGEGSPDSFIVFTSNSLINPTALDWQRIEYVPPASPPSFRYCSFTYAEEGIRSTTPGGRIDHCYFARLANQSVDMTGVTNGGGTDSLVVRYSVFNKVPLAMRMVQVWDEGLTVEHNAVFGSINYGLQLEVIRGARVFCNYFEKCGQTDSLPGPPTGVIFLSNTKRTEVANNSFQLSWYALHVGSKVDSTSFIHNNWFYRVTRVLNIGVTEGDLGASNPIFQYNCMLSVSRGYVVLASCQWNTRPIDATNNFWETTSENTIRLRISDCEDDPTCPCVTFTPFLSTCPDTIGLCGG